ncbi:cytochrome P450 [Blastococcus sp. PRF04-17]|uniref:cytochrome P450 n=1 Tax=Blastococcus sp. PRF04-17 TaxID=2933797 RepID=UPI001FF15D6D|nr:cytochrome P450 [Blastococcus sp. PRF04-17]UOY02495.1 cytochrome P450 [Blastococcus sp. PRF04-17]
MTEYDPLSAEVLDDPGPAHARLLAECPVHRFEGFEPPFYTLSRYEDVAWALKDTTTFSSRYGQGPRFTEERGMKSDPPMHTFFRRLVSKAFTPRAVAAMEPRIDGIVTDLIDAFVDRGEGDLHHELAYPLPTIVIAEMLGVPAEDRDRFKAWSDAWVTAMGSTTPELWADEIAEMRGYIHEHVAERQRRDAAGLALPDDLVSALVVAEEDGERLDAEGIVNVVRQLLVGGNETTTSLLTNALLRLTEQPGLLDRIREDPALAEVAVEESLRFDAPVLGLFRTTTCPVERHGVVIPEGEKVMLLYSAANRDPAVFEDPDVFSLDRAAHEVRRHLAFGFGIHVCLGAGLARLEGRIVLQQVARRLRDLEITAPPQRIEPFMLWGKATLPARWTPPS